MGRLPTKTSFVKGGFIPKSPGRPRKHPLPTLDNYDIKAECLKLLPRALKECERILKDPSKKSQGLKVRIAEMLADRIYGRPSQAITGAGGGPLVHSFAQILAGVDGAEKEKFSEATFAGRS